MAIEANLLWECKASGKPKPKYRWLKNGSALATEVKGADIVFKMSNVVYYTLWDIAYKKLFYTSQDPF